jgi:hypothetical protein
MNGGELAQIVRWKSNEFREACVDVDEETAARAPVGRWSPKEIVSHLIGPERVGHLPLFKAFLQEDMPTLELHSGNPNFTDTRARMTFADLLKAFDREYEAIANFVTSLSEEQLGRKAHIAELKESPLGEYPLLGSLIEGVAAYHLDFHRDQMRDILGLLRS